MRGATVYNVHAGREVKRSTNAAQKYLPNLWGFLQIIFRFSNKVPRKTSGKGLWKIYVVFKNARSG